MDQNVKKNYNRYLKKSNQVKFTLSRTGRWAVVIVFILLIILILCLTVFFRTENVNINGVTLYEEQQVKFIGGITENENLVRFNTGYVKQRLEKGLPFVYDVQVEKSYFPPEINIKCKEYQKLADIESSGAYYPISFGATILESANPKPSGNIPVIKGFELKTFNPGENLESNDKLKLDVLMKVLQGLYEDNFIEHIISVDISSCSDIILNFDNRIEIKMGSSIDIENKIKYFEAIINTKLTKDYTGTLIYNGASSGISALPSEKKAEKSADSSSSLADSSLPDNQNQNQNDQPAADAYSQNGITDNTQTDNNYNGYDNNTYDNNNNGYDNGYQDNTTYETPENNDANTWENNQTGDYGRDQQTDYNNYNGY